MSRLYTSFEDTWADFLADDDHLDDFFAEHDGNVDMWWVVPPPAVKRAALLLQSELERFDFLPHLTLALVTRRAPAGDLRAALEPLRETVIGRQDVEETIRVSFPLSRERLFEPYAVHERVPVGR